MRHQLGEELREGQQPWSDRDYKVVKVNGEWPGKGLGQPKLVPTRMDDKRDVDSESLTFVVGEKPVYVYLLLNNNKDEHMPAWVTEKFKKSETRVMLDWTWESWLYVWYAGPFLPKTPVALGGAEYDGEGNDDNYSVAVRLADEAMIPLTAEVASNSEGVEIQTYSLGGSIEGKYNFLMHDRISALVALLHGKISDPANEFCSVGSTVTGIEVFNGDGMKVSHEEPIGDHAQATLTINIKVLNVSTDHEGASA